MWWGGDGLKEEEGRNKGRFYKIHLHRYISFFAVHPLDCKFIFVGKSSIPIGKLKSLVKSNDGEIVMDPDEATVCICTLDSYINKVSSLFDSATL